MTRMARRIRKAGGESKKHKGHKERQGLGELREGKVREAGLEEGEVDQV